MLLAPASIFRGRVFFYRVIYGVRRWGWLASFERVDFLLVFVLILMTPPCLDISHVVQIGVMAMARNEGRGKWGN